MPIRLPRLLLLSAACLCGGLGGGAAAAQDDITIYRCTDARGHLTLQDSPCAGDEAQQTRRMLQPDDPPPRPAIAPSAPAAPESSPAAAPVVVIHAPRPMYECVRPDGSRYTSDDGDGNPRWISSGWGYVGPARWHPRRGTPAAVPDRGGESAAPGGGAQTASGRPALRFRDATPDRPSPRPPPRGDRGDHGLGWSHGEGGGWVRDDCQPLPQREVCARLRDRREEIRDRAFNAQANERATLSREERGIDARLAEDCGGR